MIGKYLPEAMRLPIRRLGAEIFSVGLSESKFFGQRQAGIVLSRYRSKMPRVSIGLPVYNGEKYLEEVIESLLTQTFDDFELIISDNASTDRTRQICEQYTKKDFRVRYYRNEKNIGAADNFNKIFNLSSGEYFKWAAGDDILHPKFLSKCVEILEKEQDVVLCHSKTLRIDESGKVTGSYYLPMRYNSPEVSLRFKDLILKPHSCVMIFGVVKSDILKKTNLIGPYLGSDRNLLAELSLHGRLYEIPEFLFSRRDHSDASVRKYPIRERIAWFDTRKTNCIILPSWRNLFEYFRSTTRVSITFSDRIKCLRYLILWVKENWRWLGSDIRFAAKQLVNLNRVHKIAIKFLKT